ncbi:hypothetical protein C9J12_02890 [Photobacterium frigidiphilum]|uniref:RmlD-like substrate binding domain-containing protein n=1 Tax=Photobacterium frigidiphilum TaxID=264736 RepID=A0A2T3JPE2_9GAMM|nr:SDR family oxidoreductase [Photobacterium frigidiphilum]PSU50929.1 hypothetical protein C9J12_02890 [Photobacterium frigidiphilum]
MKKVVIVGSNGLLGSSLLKVLADKYEVTTITRKSEHSDYQVDMTSLNLSQSVLSDISPDFIINLAALTNVDTCECDINLAYLVNTKIAENIACFSKKHNTFIIHISTDHLYNQNNATEQDVEICNSYAMTKYCAERSYNPNNSIVLRTNFFGKSHSESSLGLCNTIYKQAQEGIELKLFNDVYFSPLSIITLCDVINVCLRERIPGVFNVGSKNGMSKEQFLRYFLIKAGVENLKYKSISVDDVCLKTPRPKDMRMNVSLFERTYKYNLPKLMIEIENVANEFK